MQQDIFNRREIKYVIDSAIYDRLVHEVRAHMDLDIHNVDRDTYPILNLYYDTWYDDLVIQTLLRPSYRYKLRLRCYEMPVEPATLSYIEVKKKIGSIVSKRRAGVPYEHAIAFLDHDIMPPDLTPLDNQVLHEMREMLRQKPLVPRVMLAYDRVAFFGVEGYPLRVSFDSHLRARRNDLSLLAGDHGDPVLPYDQHILEIKTERNLPLWLVGLLSEYELRQTSFSKYRTEFQNAGVLARNETGDDETIYEM